MLNSILLLFGNFGAPELIIIVVIILLLFGGRKIPELMRGIGKGIRSYKEGLDRDPDDLHRQRINFEGLRTQLRRCDMQVLLEKGYVVSYALEGNLVDGIEANAPPDMEHFMAHFKAYRMRDGTLEYDGQQNTEIEKKALCDDLRKRRETECFSYINRGQLWYDRLSDEQKSELQVWYADWLKVTDTLTAPEKPSWLY